MYRQITGCRICGSEWLEVLLELGTQFLTGVFPRSPDESLTKGPLTLVRCDECGLVQLLYSYERTELYGAHYAYRSSLNRTMVNHLEAKAQMLMRTVDLRPDDVIVDVGSNDGTLLSFFSGRNLSLLGFDPSAARWRRLSRRQPTDRGFLLGGPLPVRAGPTEGADRHLDRDVLRSGEAAGVRP